MDSNQPQEQAGAQEANAQNTAEHESMEFDVLVVGGGPAGLATAIHLRQLGMQNNQDYNICLIEKGSEIGAHILSGAVLDPRALNELIPDWKKKNAPLDTPVQKDEVYFFLSEKRALRTPGLFVPPPMHNKGNYIVSMGNLCRWLATQAEELGIMLFPGFAAESLLYSDDGSQVIGVATGDMGLSRDGEHKGTYTPGYHLKARYTVLAEGCRGHLGKQLMQKFQLNQDSAPQHYGIGLKEIWEVPAEQHREGLVVHGAGWPLGQGASGGSFLYHASNNQVFAGLIVDLSYSNPHLSPYEEFQRFKHHPVIASTLQGGKRISYGARALVKGGIQALPKMSAPGVLLVGDDAGTLNAVKIKGNHTAMKSGMVAAEVLHQRLAEGCQGGADLQEYGERFLKSWAGKELYTARNFAPAMHRLGLWIGSAFTWLDQTIFRGHLPFTIKDPTPDHATLVDADKAPVIQYPKPDGTLSFDKLSSVFLSSTNHEEDQPCHLQLADSQVPVNDNLPKYAEPAQRYCPAGVYEIVDAEASPRFQINAQNCVHCKTCDIKDPAQNITWVSPEGGGGPNYPNM